MSKATKILLTSLVFAVIIILIVVLSKSRNTPSSAIYQKVVDVQNTLSLQQHFVLDNPNGDGSDPTGGAVNYMYPFSKDANGNPVPNVNGNLYWQDIGLPNNLIQDYTGGVQLNVTSSLDQNNNAGAVRLSSRKLFRGGLFIVDLEHVPYGCAVWPAVWLNGFVGNECQYHSQIGSNIYNQSMAKLAQSSAGKLCSQPLQNQKPDPHMSQYLGRTVYMGLWPLGGEIDIVEQTNFSDTNLISIHSGPRCEVSTVYGQNWWDSYDDAYANIRNCCGQTYSGLGPYSGCSGNEFKIDNLQTTLPDGSSRYNCPGLAAYNAGMSQTVGPPGSFGAAFNANGGGIYATQWIPQDKVFIWYWPVTNLQTRNQLAQSGGPLSDNPNPDSWDHSPNSATLIASYNLKDVNAIHSGCDFNYQAFIVNTVIGGGFGGGSMPFFCSVNYNNDWKNYMQTCYQASPQRATEQGSGVDPQNGCFDGGLSANGRGPDAVPVFYTEAYFKIRKLRVFQKSGDDNVW